MKAFIGEWISSGFGAPNKVLVDNGSEFDNPDYLDVMAQFNVEVLATAAYSPWSNGICERNHAVVVVMVQKIIEEEPKIYALSLILESLTVNGIWGFHPPVARFFREKYRHFICI